MAFWVHLLEALQHGFVEYGLRNGDTGESLLFLVQPENMTECLEMVTFGLGKALGRTCPPGSARGCPAKVVPAATEPFLGNELHDHHEGWTGS
jgi:hypothetical protein